MPIAAPGRVPVVWWLVLAALYYGSGRLGLAAGALTGNVTPVWPPTGLAVAALILFGYRLWPGVAIGALLVNGLSEVPLGTAVLMAAGNTGEALLGTFLFLRVAHARPALARVSDVLAFGGLVGLVATTVSATVGVLALRLGDVIPSAEMLTTWRVWWVGDALGALVVAPVLLTWLALRWRRPTTPELVEALVLAAALVTVASMAFTQHFQHSYPVFPLVIWASLRFQQRGAAAATLIIATIAVLGTRAGHGAYGAGTATHRLWLLDNFLAVVAVTGLLLAAVACERNRESRRNARLATQLRDKVVELESANAELEAFSYSVSHDLRAPLRNIDGFSRMLLKRHSADLDEKGRHYLERVRFNAHAMGRLIDDLLAMSRLQRQVLHTRPVDLRTSVDDALGLLESHLAGRDLDISIGALPVCDADPGLVTQVYVNLIGNSVKFTEGRTPGRIEIGSIPGDGQTCTLFVRDNGVGFDMAFAGKLFGVFQRLHRAEDFEGSGVGLAIVSRIVGKHGGRVWAESAVDEGATVYFTLGGELHEPTG